MSQAKSPSGLKAPRIAVLVSGPSEAAVRHFLAKYVKTGFGFAKNQWRLRYREEHALAVISRPLRAGGDAEAFYGRHATAAALVLACLIDDKAGRDATRAWLAAKGYGPVVELVLDLGGTEGEAIDQGAEVVNFVNHNCPWRVEPVDDIEAYLKKNKPAWA